MSVAQSRARSRSRAPSMRTRMPGPIIVDVPAKPPIIVDIPARPRSRSVGKNGPLATGAPGLSGGRGMFKRLIVACDGTWMNSDNGMLNGKLAVPSNVTRISRAIKTISQDGIPQIVNYSIGLGTQGSPISRIVGGTTGEGLADNVRVAYSFLATNYHPGDEIFLIGFSRGAFTARSIAGLIGEVGLLTKKGLNDLPEVFEDVQHRRDPNYRAKNPDSPFPRKPSASDPEYAEELERRGLTRLGVPIKAIGVWDTVGSLGAPRIGKLQRIGLQSKESKEMAFYDTKLSNCIENAFQALALDERRSSFAPAIWEKPEGNRTTLRQVWFPGVHANIGGGYDDQQLANITLAWMMSQLEPFLDMRDDYLFEQDDENDAWYRKDGQQERPWSFGEIYNSLSGLFGLGGSSTRTPGQYYAVDPFTGRTTDRPLRQTNEYIHPSVRTRFKLSGPGVADKGMYECRALNDSYRVIVDYGLNTTRTADPEVFWKIRWRDTIAVRVLPEAPLWRLERELARKDAETYDFIKRPPATGKKRRSVRPGTAEPSTIVESSDDHHHNHQNHHRRRNTAVPHSGYSADEREPRRSNGAGFEKRGMGRSKSRPRSAVFDRDTVVRDEMLQQREKEDKKWWDSRKQAMRD